MLNTLKHTPFEDREYYYFTPEDLAAMRRAYDTASLQRPKAAQTHSQRMTLAKAIVVFDSTLPESAIVDEAWLTLSDSYAYRSVHFHERTWQFKLPNIPLEDSKAYFEKREKEMAEALSYRLVSISQVTVKSNAAFRSISGKALVEGNFILRKGGRLPQRHRPP
jgi:hypothetical protein